ncbi:dephospho-CoA kinase [Mariniplasma anaerobium]|uniref:Dephospho-CoA kinase n=2 Tax=Mariniplasma anaerobium TaxID=2735436 RepID=A0A7U9TGG1_9MOLU|nr:dephospho-CoA kinase [Mariniplasma anaerobium]
MDHMSVQIAKNKPYIVGLTGGIASGKSTAAAYIKSLNIKVIDSDEIVKNLWKENNEMILKAESLFGFSIKTDADKEKIKKAMCEDKRLRLKLNEITHPFVFKEIKRQLLTFENEKIVVIDMPLLFEVSYEKKCDITCLVYVSKNIQLMRLMSRDDMLEKDAKKLINCQLSLEHKKMKADVIFDNESDLDYLYFQIDQFLRGLKL